MADDPVTDTAQHKCQALNLQCSSAGVNCLRGREVFHVRLAAMCAYTSPSGMLGETNVYKKSSSCPTRMGMRTRVRRGSCSRHCRCSSMAARSHGSGILHQTRHRRRDCMCARPQAQSSRRVRRNRRTGAPSGPQHRIEHDVSADCPWAPIATHVQSIW